MRVTVAIMTILNCSVALAVTPLEFKVMRTGAQLRVDVPMVIDMTGRLPEDASERAWRLIRISPKPQREVPCQLVCDVNAFDGKGKLLLCFLLEPHGDEQPPRMLVERFKLIEKPRPSPPAFAFEERAGKFLTLREGDRMVMTYIFASILAPYAPERYRRGCYVHPLYDLDGNILTDDFPKDHMHHRALFWSPKFVWVDGKRYFPWVMSGMTLRFARWLRREVGAVCALLGAENEWRIGDKAVAREEIWFRVFRAGKIGRTIDVEWRMEALSKPVTIQGADKMGYGGFCIRFAPNRETCITSSEGKLERDTWEKRFSWCDLSGKFGKGDNFSGIAIFDHPSNLNHPTTWANYYFRNRGFLNPTFPGARKYTIEPHKPLRLRYRLWIHRGDAKGGHVTDAYDAFIKPPSVKM